MPDISLLYIKLIASFLADKMTLEEFEGRYFKLFKSDNLFGPTEENRALSEVFSALDCIDMEHDSPYKVTEAQLRQDCAAAIKTLQSLNAGRYKSFENKVETLPEHLQKAHRMLECAFPKGIPRSLYHPLVILLSKSFGNLNLVYLLACYTGMRRENVGYDVDFAQFPDTPPYVKNLRKNMSEVEKILRPCGYQP